MRRARGPKRVLTEIPVRVLYVLTPFGCVDRVALDPREVVARLAVARRRD